MPHDNGRQRYARIPTDIWRNPHFRSLHSTEQWTLILLMCDREISRLGHLHVKWKIWGQAASDATSESVECSVLALDDAGWVAYDGSTDEVWVRPYLAMQQTWQQPGLAIAAARDYDRIFSPLLRALVLDAVPEAARAGWPDNLANASPRSAKRLLETGEEATPRAPRRTIPPNLRAQIYARDGLRCVACGSRDDLTIDHITAVANGGTNDPSNLQTMCQPCNSRKGDR